MNDIRTIANHILSLTGEISSMKLHKLLYYVQAYGLAWTGEKMFADPIIVGVHGPMFPVIFPYHEESFHVDSSMIPSGEYLVDDVTVKVVGGVVSALKGFTGWELYRRYSFEEPYLVVENNVLCEDSVKDYYSRKTRIV